MKIFLSSLLSFIAASLVIGCGKDVDTTPKTSTTENLTASAWKVDAAGVDQDRNGTIEIPVLSFIPACTVDNTISFKKDNTGLTDEGATKCNTTDAQTTVFNWNFSDAETNINLSNSVLSQLNGRSKILLLNQTSLHLTKDTVISGVTMALIVQLKH